MKLGFKHCCLLFLSALQLVSMPAQGGQPKYKNFRVAIYVTRDTVSRWSNLNELAVAYDNMSRQVKFDKVYIEIATARNSVNEATIDPIRKFFQDRGIEVSGATALNGGGNQSATPTGASLSYVSQTDRDWVKSVAEMSARHFDELILDDWFFTASKTAGDIAAKGDKSWTQYRMETMDEAAENLLIKPAKAINPKMHLIIKYPNWYEHYQGLGYDLDVEPKIFDAIYTGVETRDPIFTEQHLQQYESYSIVRYLENVKPGGNDGAWVDTLETQYLDRYPEQVLDMALAKPREITLWQWNDALRPIAVGNRPWQDQPTSFDYQKILATYHSATTLPSSDQTTQPARNLRQAGPINDARNGRLAGYTLEQADAFLDKLGNPIGIAAYRPPHAIGEEFYYDYFGMAGFPIDLHSTFPSDTKSPVILLTESAKNDPDIVRQIKAELAQGKNVAITSGLLRALSGKGIEDITELEYTDQKVAVTNFMGRGGQVIADAKVDPPIIFPIIHFLTNQTWGQLNGFSDSSPANAYPIVISDAYDRGFLYVIAMPDNIADLYRLPTPVLNSLRRLIMGNFPVRLIDAPAQVSLFAYDNNAFVVQSFLPTEAKVTVAVAGQRVEMVDLLTQEPLSPSANAPEGNGSRRGRQGPAATRFTITLPPHSYRAFGMK